MRWNDLQPHAGSTLAFDGSRPGPAGAGGANERLQTAQVNAGTGTEGPKDEV